MRQVRIRVKDSPAPPLKWMEVYPEMVPKLISMSESGDYQFEFRNKPNIFTRIREWWDNV